MLRRTTAFAVLALATAACRSPGPGREQVESVLAEQAACWNRGDLRGFVRTYWDDADLTFVGSTGLRRGPDDLLAGYERGYP
ncbi:MAG: hypothetical protein KDB80_04760, partial [Planctomycetes bacterium]|nr:hypothetical protein [Planctomycetota bacterium]